MEERMKDRMENLSKGGCAICGVKAKNHKTKYNKETGTTTSFTHSFDGGNFEDFKFKSNPPTHQLTQLRENNLIKE